MRAGIAAWLALLLAIPAAVHAEDPAAAVRAALTQWTEDFNARRTDKVCDLFARDLRYDFQGFPERNYADVCGVLQRSLQESSRRYSHALNIKEILTSGDLAVVRLVWTLTITPPEGTKIVMDEVGMDIFRRQQDGSWKIVRYMAYESR